MIKLIPQTPKQTLNKAFLKQRPLRKDIDIFKDNLVRLLGKVDEIEREENQKNHIRDFLRDTFYKENNEINTKDSKDLVIHLGKTNKDKVGVIIEAKRPSNRGEMMSADKPNTKALHELILYYLDERNKADNNEVKQLIITNVYEWFIFDANSFDKVIYRNAKIKRLYETYVNDQKDTPFFYSEVGKIILTLDSEVICTHFDIRDYKRVLLNEDKTDDKNLIALFKILSPYHLLKLPFANDSNSLDKTFYSELLHIIGLTETKDGGKKIIQRPVEGQRNNGSLLENAISQLDSMDKIGRLQNAGQYGSTYNDRLFNVGLELAITWINRILFLKLLEAQLVSYHKGDAEYAFLNYKRIQNFDDLNSLFFAVLARKQEDRQDEIKWQFSKVPYLNSSLFEITALENQAIVISNLRDERVLPILIGTVLKDHHGRKRTGTLNTIEYLFAFMDAYDFSSEGSEDIQEENKTLINASVLGLIFEKINGYKDGSFFTPGFITMYMCRETIRLAVVQKFNEAKGWNCTHFDELYNKIEDKKEANAIINSLKICDPAVGSGHFLVSALNELITIKRELNVLMSSDGRTLRDYNVEVENDELIVTDENGNTFTYHAHNRESQRIQETLFHEKQTIIENCLFGVDINPNSVKICRLRLWIELLKNSYYKADSQFTELETLPNIDINIKCGNSLISRFALDADLKQALRNSKGAASRWTIDTYKIAVQTYRNAKSKEEKREMERLIEDIKGNFRSEISSNDPKLKKLSRLSGELYNLLGQHALFEPSKTEKKLKKQTQEKLEKEISSLTSEVEEIKSNKIYENAFEWRFEFPEVLNDEGDFMGFNVVIGNPPYIRIQDLQSQTGVVEYYNDNYFSTGSGNYDLYIPFIELGLNLLSVFGEHCYIMPHKFTNANYGEKIREFITKDRSLRRIIHFGANQVFEDATTYTGLFFFTKTKIEKVDFFNCDNFSSLKSGSISFSNIPTEILTKNEWAFLPEAESILLTRLLSKFQTLEQVTDRIFQGLKTSADKIFILEKITETEHLYEVFCRENDKTYWIEKTILFPLIKGGNSRSYQISSTDLLILFPYKNGQLILQQEFEENIPAAWQYLNEHKTFLENRENGSMKGIKWYAFGRNQAIDVIVKPKIFTPDIAPSPRISYDSDGSFMFTGGVSGGYGIVPKPNISPLLLMAILNSKVAFWFIKRTSTQMRGGWYSFESRYIKNIPIAYPIDGFEDLEALVRELIQTKKSNHETDTTNLEKQIDQLVYGLYGLTEEEIGIVEA